MGRISLVKVIESNRITLEVDVRSKLDVQKGDFVAFVEDEHGQLIIKKVEA
jgi:hypothetical protein